MASHVGYQGATGCLPDAQQGARALMASGGALRRRGAINSGILNCRPVVGAPHDPLHSEGRAADLGVRPISGLRHEAAGLVHPTPGELGIQCVIWSRGIWSGSRPTAGSLYKGQNPHRDHLHVELSWPAAHLTHARIVEVLGGGPGRRVLKLKKPHMRGEDVRPLQIALAARFPSLGLGTDGIFGPKTDKAVKKFQRSVGLSPDGDVGPRTRAALVSGETYTGRRRAPAGLRGRTAERLPGRPVTSPCSPRGERACGQPGRVGHHPQVEPRARASSVRSRSRPIPALGRYVVGRRSRVNRAPAGSAASRASRSRSLARSSSPRTSATDGPGSPRSTGVAGWARRAVRRPGAEPHRRAGVAALDVHLVGQVPHELPHPARGSPGRRAAAATTPSPAPPRRGSRRRRATS